MSEEKGKLKALDLAVQQIENIFISPRVLGKSVQLHPVLVMVVLVIGSEIAGVLGQST